MRYAWHVSDSLIPSVIVGLATGVGLVLVLAGLSTSSLQNPNINELDNMHFENKLQHDNKAVPNLILITQDSRLFQGEEGTYCITTPISMNLTSAICADSAGIFPQTLITLEKGSKVEFRTSDKATLNNIQPWVTNNQAEHIIVLNGTKSLGSGNTAFRLDLPRGDYFLNADVRWTFDNTEGRSYYFYRIHIL